MASALAHYIEFSSTLPAFWQANVRVTAREKSVGERKTSFFAFSPVYSVFCATTPRFVPVRWEDSCRTLVFQRSVTGRVSNNPLRLKRTARCLRQLLLLLLTIFRTLYHTSLIFYEPKALQKIMETNPIPILTIQTTPFDDQRPGTNGLRKKTAVFESKKNYLQNYIQSVLSSIDLRDRQGCTMVVGSDGRYFSRAATEVIVQMAAANGVRWCLYFFKVMYLVVFLVLFFSFFWRVFIYLFIYL